MPNLYAPFVHLFLCLFMSHKYAGGPLNAVKAAESQRGQAAQGLSAKGTVNTGTFYPGRPRYDKSELREERRAVELGQDRASDQVG